MDNSWSEGIGGFRYNDGDDNTIIESTVSLFLRNKFIKENTSNILTIAFHIDYDDAFVA